MSGGKLDAIFGRVFEYFGERCAEMLSVESLTGHIGVFSGFLPGLGP